MVYQRLQRCCCLLKVACVVWATGSRRNNNSTATIPKATNSTRCMPHLLRDGLADVLAVVLVNLEHIHEDRAQLVDVQGPQRPAHPGVGLENLGYLTNQLNQSSTHPHKGEQGETSKVHQTCHEHKKASRVSISHQCQDQTITSRRVHTNGEHPLQATPRLRPSGKLGCSLSVRRPDPALSTTSSHSLLFTTKNPRQRNYGPGHTGSYAQPSGGLYDTNVEHANSSTHKPRGE